ncbi:hypothetical protein [Microvirga pudoricolor]|uniref:hypothetical protein n=1 Tax=Microvirga pudoricolor TaxID=2778729 RepID=UPI00194F9D5A|nr:hypothetical protein [Microvirga pudoricolor]MBM6596363.1 hypothetical protein [Microvirga pudoricolor]
MTELADDRVWRQFAVGFAATALGLFALLFGFIVIMDPFGLRAAPGRPLTPIMDVNQRFMYPQLIRSGRYDSAVFGTSTVRLLDPDRLGRALGGRFMNLGMNAATPWEQMQLANLFLQKNTTPKSLVFGLDTTWCEEDADAKKLTFRAFPPWLYDDDPLNDYPELVNLTALEVAGRVALNRLGLMVARIPPNGYEIFVPDDASYDLERARFHLNQWQPPPAPARPVRLDRKGAAALHLPALAWLGDTLARVPASASVTLAFMPNNVRAQPQAGTREAAVDRVCKDRIASIAKHHGAALVDFRVRSPVTEEDSNYWDPLHYRIGIANRVVDGLETARATGRDAPDGFYRVLSPPRP